MNLDKITQICVVLTLFTGGLVIWFMCVLIESNGLLHCLRTMGVQFLKLSAGILMFCAIGVILYYLAILVFFMWQALIIYLLTK